MKNWIIDFEMALKKDRKSCIEKWHYGGLCWIYPVDISESAMGLSNDISTAYN